MKIYHTPQQKEQRAFENNLRFQRMGVRKN
jgi:hypothetical protein